MKKLLSLLTLLVVAVSTFGQTFTLGDLEYTVLSSTDKTAKVSNGKNATGDVVVPETVTYNDVEYRVREIGYQAFKDNTSVTSVEMPSITAINGSAFSRCTSLVSVSLPAAISIGGSAFYYCASLISIELPVAISIGSSAFEGCESLEAAIIPNVETLGSYAFGSTWDNNESRYHSCISLKHLDLSSVKSMESFAFNKCTNITSLRIGSVDQWCKVNFGDYYSNPLQNTTQTVELYVGDSEIPTKNLVASNTLTKIPDYAFSRVAGIESISAPAVTSVGAWAFQYCSLKSAELPAASSVGGYAFQYCSSLKAVELPAVTSVGIYAFQYCSSLTTVELPVVTSVSNWAFQYCSSLTSAALPVANLVGRSAFYSCSSMASVDLPSATSIEDFAFTECNSLTSLSLPVTKSIGNNAFSNCSSLSYISLPAATSIGNYAFNNCKSLTSLSLPVTTSIGPGAFSSCPLSSVSLPAATYIGERAFYGNRIKSLHIGGIEQWCNISFSGAYANPLQNSSVGADLYIGDSDLPVEEIAIPESVMQIPEYAFQGIPAIHTVHLEGSTPPALINTNSFPSWTMLAVPDEAYQTYMAADVYKTIPLQITKEGSITKEVELEANSGTSDLLSKISEDVRHVINLKISGTINSYDMLIIRNQMTSLRNLDLTDASIVDCDYIYSNANGIDYHSQKDVVNGEWLSGLMHIKLPVTTKSIGSRAFYNCARLMSVNIPDGVISIGNEAFWGCRKITSIILPQSLNSIEKSAFEACGIHEIIIPNGVSSIENSTFKDCSNLTKVAIHENVERIKGLAFYGCGPLELYIPSMEAWNEIVIGGGGGLSSLGEISDAAFFNINKLYVGDSKEPVENIIIPEGTTELKANAFAGFKCIKSFILPKSLTVIGKAAFRYCSGLSEIKLSEKLSTISNSAFSECSNLESIEFTDSIKSIGTYSFYGCSKLSKVELPSYLQSIGSYAFENCTNLSEMLIPASIKEIKDYAFRNCPNLNRVIATTVEPVRINQNTFSTYKTATLFTPKTSYYKYYWNTQYNQFLGKKEYDKEFAKTFEYKYFYLNGVNGDEKQDLTIDDETGTIHGAGDKNPDADFNEGAGVIVGGEQIQNLGDIHIHHNGNNGASVIAKNQGKVHIDNLYVDIKTQKNRWYFFCFPFDIKPSEANFVGSHVWYLYDGAARALNGNGGWKKVASDGVMQSGNGYIFQGAINGTLTIHVKDITIDTNDNSTNMITYQSNNKNDASWNLIGNSNFAYYDINNLGYEAPITVYNNETGNYEAVRAGEDDCELYPFQAFFVQKPEGTESLDFDNSMKETKNMSDASQTRKAAARAKAPKKVDALRKVINLELASADLVADSVAVPTDRTRIVVNPTKSTAYETDCDAAKFLADNMPQIYSLGLDGCTYAINERPVANGIVSIAVKTVKSGMYTITAPRLDREAKLRDLETGAEVDLSKGGYTFAAEAQTYTDRFQLILADEATAITAAEDEMAGISVEAGAIRISKANADVKIYSVGGSLVASQKGEGSIHMPAGIYVVVVNGKSTKVTVKE